MPVAVSVTLWVVAAIGLAAVAVQAWTLASHARGADPSARRRPLVSVLKPLCGVDDDLDRNLASFAGQDYPAFEVLLGVRSRDDAAYPHAIAARARRAARTGPGTAQIERRERVAAPGAGRGAAHVLGGTTERRTVAAAARGPSGATTECLS